MSDRAFEEDGLLRNALMREEKTPSLSQIPSGRGRKRELDDLMPVRDHHWYISAYFAVVLGAVLLLATLLGGAAILLERTRQTSLYAAEARLQNTSEVVATTLNRQLLQVDGALASLPGLFAVAAPGLDAKQAKVLLRAFNFDTFACRDLLLVKPDGTIWASARPRPVDVALPPFPPRAATEPGAASIEGPTVNPLTGDEAWFLTRDTSIPNLGKFLAVAEIPVSSITTLLAPIADVPGLRIDILRSNGTRLANLPYDALQLGKPGYLAPMKEQPPRRPFVMPAARSTTGALIVWAQTLYPDVNVVLTIDMEAALAEWMHDRNRLLMVVVAAGFLIITLSVTLLAALRQREAVEQERKGFRDMLDNAIETMSDGFVMWDAEDRLVTCNRQYLDIYAVSAPFIKPGMAFEDIIREGAKRGQYPQAGADIEAFVRKTVAWHRGNTGALERLLPDGRWILTTERRTAAGGTVGIRTDITPLKRALSELEGANARVKTALADLQVQNEALTDRDHAIRTQNVLFTAALSNMSQGLLMVDSDQRLIVCNSRFHDIFRLEMSAAAPGTTVAALLRMSSGGIGATALAEIFDQHSHFAEEKRAGAFFVLDGDELALSISQRPLPDGGWVATYEDVTERQRAEGRIRFLAHHDALTQLPNRVLFRARMDDALRRVGQRDASLALLYLDLDKFKYINDSLGHPAGDSLLEAAAKRLRNCVRECDIVARLGGDEFAIGVISDDMPDAATTLALRVIESLSAPYDLGTRQALVGVSIGIAITTGDDADCDQLLKQADMALYKAKADGRGTYAIFAEEMERQLNARVTIEAELGRALERQEFQLVYQPIFTAEGQRLCGFEALLRWNHPSRGMISPGLFIPWAEEFGIINAVGKWALGQACADIIGLPDHLVIAVNLSPVQLMDRAIVEHVQQALSEWGVSPVRLELEITESALLGNTAETRDVLRQLRRLGLSIALDDFGTGYSSLSHLRSFPLDTIKIDRLFVSEMATRRDCAAIVNSIASLASRLGMSTTAEGVETDEQLRLVRDAGCTAAQGYLLGRPQPIETAKRNLLAGTQFATEFVASI